MPSTKARRKVAKAKKNLIPVSEAAPRMIRNSERQSFKRCRFQWNWNFGILTGTPLKPKEEGKALRFGDLVHQSLAAYYKPGRKRGKKPWLIFERLYRDQLDSLGPLNMRPDDETKWMEADELGCAMLKGYYKRYHEHDLEYEVIASEQTFQLPLIVPECQIRLSDTSALILPEFTVIIVGTTDGVWKSMSGSARSNAAFFAEHKTTKAIDLAGLPMDEQAGTYWTFAPRHLWKLGYMPRKTYPEYILYNFLRKAMPDERPTNELGQFLNMDGGVSKKQPAAYFARQPVYRDEHDRQQQYDRVLDEAREMELVRMGVLKPIKNPGPLYMPNCRGCPFRDPCELHETGSDYQSVIDGFYQTWNPYAAHEIIERW